jgi:hypothetical protein
VDKLEWTALEYEEKTRNADWFWALGVIVLTSSLAAIIYGNYFFAALIVISGVLLAFFATKKPDIVTYELNSKGLKIRSRLYLYEDIKSFWVQTNFTSETNFAPTLFIKTERVFMPIIAIPIEDSFAGDIQSIMLANNVPEEEMKEHPSEKIMESLGF